MTTVLIAYPELFACRTKFLRKVQKITRRLTAFSIVYMDDGQSHIKDFFDQEPKAVSLEPVACYSESQASHAIIFDDGESFEALKKWLHDNHCKTRVIPVKITRVINLKKHQEYQGLTNTQDYAYIGRGSYWGNPHSMFEEGDTREEVIRKYQYDFEYNKFLNIDPSRVHELAGKRLGCFCKPAPCHGDVLADFLNRYDDGK